MTIAEMKERKKELGYTNEDIARLSGLPLSTVCKIFSGATSSPRRSTVLALESVLTGRKPGGKTTGKPSGKTPPYLEGLKELREQILQTQPGVPIGETIGYLVQYGCGGPIYWEPVGRLAKDDSKPIDNSANNSAEAGNGSISHSAEDSCKPICRSAEEKVSYEDSPGPGSYLVREPEPAYANIPVFLKRSERLAQSQGEYTIEDYLALPEDVRVELINGYFYNLAAPTPVHQLISASIFNQLTNFAEKNHTTCIPFIAPLDVQLCKDDKNMVQPDVMILCKPEQLLKNGRVYGAPDFIVEVLSPSNRKLDLYRKLERYIAAGVREYWIVDPRDRKICVHDFESDHLPKIYDFADQVPVMIWEGKCMVDFQKISEKLTRIPAE